LNRPLYSSSFIHRLNNASSEARNRLVFAALVQIVCWRHNENIFDLLTEIAPEVPNVASDEMSRLCLQRSEENGNILLQAR